MSAHLPITYRPATREDWPAIGACAAIERHGNAALLRSCVGLRNAPDACAIPGAVAGEKFAILQNQ